MFSFHKPKVYRSSTGCCICKAKSSSSRFTDSKKYEDDFIECFQLQERRTGEICNACVLLVKRWKKLPTGSNRNWSHVVDARAGPGIKSLTKFKSKNKKKIRDTFEKSERIIKKKHVYLKTERDREQSPTMSDELTEYYIDGKSPIRMESPADNDDIANNEKQLGRTIENTKEDDNINSFIDLSYFKRELICCGTIFKGPYGEVIVDPSLMKPCIGCIARQERQRQENGLRCSSAHSSASASPVHSSASASPEHNADSAIETTVSKQNNKTFSDSSSDSGYDESSNQGLGESKSTHSTAKTEQSTKSVQSETVPVTEAVRLKTDIPIKLLPMQQLDQLECKPLSVMSPTNIAVDVNTSRSIVTVNPLIDFATHTTSMQSVSN